MENRSRIFIVNFLFFIAYTVLISALSAGTLYLAQIAKLPGIPAAAVYIAGSVVILALSFLFFRLFVKYFSNMSDYSGVKYSLTVIRMEMETLQTFLDAADRIRASENQTAVNEKFDLLREKFTLMKNTLAEYEKNLSGRKRDRARIISLSDSLQEIKKELAVIIEQFSDEYLRNKSLVNYTYNNMASLIYHLAVSMPILMDFTNIFNSFSKDMILEVINKFGDITVCSHRVAEEIEVSINSLMDDSREDSLSFIIRKAHDLVMDFENFYQNMDNLKSVSDNFTEKSAEKLHNIQDIANSIEEIAETIKVLSLNVSIEAANSGTSGRGFQVLARDLREFTTRTMRFAHDVKNRVKDALNTTENLKGNYVQSMAAVYRYMDDIKSSIRSFEGIINTSFDKLKVIVDSLRGFSSSIDAGIKEVVSKLQYYDITSQEVEHLRLFFEKIFINIYNSRSIHMDVGTTIPDQEKTAIKTEILKIISEIVTTANERQILRKYEESFGISPDKISNVRETAIQRKLKEDSMILF